MRKVLIAFDGPNFSTGAFEFARQMNAKEPILLTGVFIPQLVYASMWNYTDAMVGPMGPQQFGQGNADEIDNNISHFEKLCLASNIVFRTHYDFYDFPLVELKKESKYADLLILSGEKFYGNIDVDEPNEYLRNVLHSSFCPIMIIPEKFHYPKQNILAYDGSANSVYAIKQFAYLFPEFADNKTKLIYTEDNANKPIPDEDYITELSTQHFSKLTVMKLDIDAKKFFNTWLTDTKSPVLVTGAFGRSAFSSLFHHSFISEVIADHLFPIFIAHK